MKPKPGKLYQSAMEGPFNVWGSPSNVSIYKTVSDKNILLFVEAVQKEPWEGATVREKLFVFLDGNGDKLWFLKWELKNIKEIKRGNFQ